jgi:hypothetical protein
MNTDKALLEYSKLKDGKQTSPYLRALIYLVVNGFGSFLPIIIIWYVFFYDTMQMPASKSVFRNGEIIIICISLIISCIYSLLENYKKKNGIFIATLILCGLTLIGATIVYMTAYQSQYSLSIADLGISKKESIDNIMAAISHRDEISKKIDEKFDIIKWVSIILGAWSLAAIYISQVFNYIKNNPHMVEKRNDELNDLAAEFNKL